MVSINANTKYIPKKTVASTTQSAANNTKNITSTTKSSSNTSKLSKTDSKRGQAPSLKPKRFTTLESISSFQSSISTASELQEQFNDLFRQILGGPAPLFSSPTGIATPRAASTSIERGSAAADLAMLTKSLGVITVLKKSFILERIEQILIPNGIGAVFGNEKGMNPGGGMRKIASSVSLASMGSTDRTLDTTDMASTVVSDTKKGKTASPEAREGCLFFLRALAEIVGPPSEPFIVPLLAAALDEVSSSSVSVREAAEDTATSIISLANTYAVPILVCPVLFEALHSPDWRVKTLALEKLAQCASAHPKQISPLLPKIIPQVSGQVWDTKPQVTKAAATALLRCCETNINPDVAPAIPAVVNAICKPNDTMKAVDELKGTTFVATVDASTLSILCPILSRGLKDKMAINKRSCCIVIENMSRLVETPSAVAPFGPLLVPELKRVAENVQFEEIRDAALAALNALTKALGHSSIDDAVTSIMQEENQRIEAEQRRIEEERAAEKEREELNRVKEEEERRLWKEAMEAQRLLDKMALEAEEEKKAEVAKQRELQKKSTKSGDGKCKGCGLKKCKKTCLFYSG